MTTSSLKVFTFVEPASVELGSDGIGMGDVPKDVGETGFVGKITSGLVGTVAVAATLGLAATGKCGCPTGPSCTGSPASYKYQLIVFNISSKYIIKTILHES
jgi:hypothetical protein